MSGEAGCGEISMGSQEDMKKRAQSEKERAGDVGRDAGQRTESESDKAGRDIGGNAQENLENMGQKAKEKIRR